MGGGACECWLKMGVRGCVSACRLDGGGVPLGWVSVRAALHSACVNPFSWRKAFKFDCFRTGS